ncbi:MAG: putative oxidoreductase YteT precursor, partial [Pseudomonadota bacterium]
MGAGLLVGSTPAPAAAAPPRRLRYAIVGTGHRGSSMWGAEIHKRYSDIVEFVGLCDPNLQRAEAARRLIGVNCPVFSDFDALCREARPDLLAVTTVDAHHAHHIVQGLDRGLRVLTEKPMVTDEQQCQEVLDADRRHPKR